MALGYLLHPQLGVEPITGAVYGLVAANVPFALWFWIGIRRQS